MRWFKREEPKPQEIVHKTVVGSYNGMTVDEWFGDHSNLVFMQRLMADGKFRDAIAVLHNSAPWHIALRPDQYSAQHAAFHRGYACCLELLLSLAKMPEKTADEPEIDYGYSDHSAETNDIL